jgi:CRP-like cAMP-binding protein
LPGDEYERLLPNLEEISLPFGSVIYEPGKIIRHVYFPTSGIISLLATTEGWMLEVGIVGNEGMVGIPIFMGVNISRDRAVVQGAGSGLRMKARTFQAECEDGGPLTRLLRRYAHSRLTQVSQTAVCNRFHPISGRLARWLLMTRDRMNKNEFQLTQEFLSSMLGVRREGVNKAAGDLQRRELVSYSRGTLTILDLPGLKRVACQCYGILKKEYDQPLS